MLDQDSKEEQGIILMILLKEQKKGADYLLVCGKTIKFPVYILVTIKAIYMTHKEGGIRIFNKSVRLMATGWIALVDSSASQRNQQCPASTCSILGMMRMREG
jgi:hypothetical protein